MACRVRPGHPWPCRARNSSRPADALKVYGLASETVLIFQTPYVEGVTPADRLLHEGLVMDVKAVKETGWRRGLEIMATGAGVP